MKREKINLEYRKIMNAIEVEEFIAKAKLNAAEHIQKQLFEYFVDRVRKNHPGGAK